MAKAYLMYLGIVLIIVGLLLATDEPYVPKDVVIVTIGLGVLMLFLVWASCLGEV
jgi:hypothetical protein